MIVCLCKVVSDRQIRAAIASGADSVEAVGEHCQAGTDCGSCHGSIEKLLSACATCPNKSRASMYEHALGGE